jgi:polysaccharide biosynthesis protein PslH
MRILLMCPDSPCPPRDGGSLRIANLARSLAGYATVQLLTYVLSPEEHMALVDFGQKFGFQVRGVQRPARRHRLTRAWHKLRDYYRPYIFGPLPGPVRFNQQPIMQHALSQTLTEFKPDVILWEHWFMTGFADQARREAPTTFQILDIHELEWLRLQRLTQVNHDWTTWWPRFTWSRIQRYTLDCFSRVDQVAMLTAADQHLTQAQHINPDRLFTLPMGLMLDEYPVPLTEPQPERILFFGSFRHQPNVDALRFLLEEIWPLIQQQRPQTTLDLMGAGIPAWTQNFPNIRVLGFQPDIRLALAAASVVIAPLRFGSGVKIKILESMAFGKAVVTTPVGAEGIEAQPGTDFIVANDAQALASETIRLLANPSMRVSLGQHARQFIQAHHDANQIARDFLARLDEFGVNRERARS